jgi:L-asparaginase / beta-aspartyl-peptidase
MIVAVCRPFVNKLTETKRTKNGKRDGHAEEKRMTTEVTRGRVALVVHGGAGGTPEDLEERQQAVDRALETGWARIEDGALAAVVAAVVHLEDEPVLNAGIGACLNTDGEVELDAGVMDGTGLRVGAVAAVRDVRHPIELARRVMEDGRHALFVAGGASRFAREQGLELVDPAIFVTDRRRARAKEMEEAQLGDTVGAVARDREGRIAVAVSTGGRAGQLPGRVGDSPLVGAGFYAEDGAGAVCATGHGESFIRLCSAHRAVLLLAEGMSADDVARAAIDDLAARVGGTGGVIVVSATGDVAAAFNTQVMPWAFRQF